MYLDVFTVSSPNSISLTLLHSSPASLGVAYRPPVWAHLICIADVGGARAQLFLLESDELTVIR